MKSSGIGPFFGSRSHNSVYFLILSIELIKANKDSLCPLESCILVVFAFLGNFLFHLGYIISWHIIVHSIPLIMLFTFIKLVLIHLCSCLILVIWVYFCCTQCKCFVFLFSIYSVFNFCYFIPFACFRLSFLFFWGFYNVES